VASIVLYDGDCGVCHAAVRAILRRDPEGRFRFASLASPVGERLLREHGLESERGRTLVLVDEADGRAYVRSEAVLRIAERLEGFARLAGPLRALPKRLRDAAYDLVARRRHRLAGAPRCLVVAPLLRDRFIDGSDAAPTPTAR